MPSRRTHTKSYHGCIQCKKLRIKCDEKQPKCSKCTRKGCECTYKHVGSRFNPFTRFEVVQQQQEQLPSPSPEPFMGAPLYETQVIHEAWPPGAQACQAPLQPASTAYHEYWPLAVQPAVMHGGTEQQTPLAAHLHHHHQHQAWPGSAQHHQQQEAVQPAPAAYAGDGGAAFPWATMQDDLVHHFATQLHLQIPQPPGIRGDWISDWYPSAAQHMWTHSYVYHAVLSFSALHIASLQAAAALAPGSAPEYQSWSPSTMRTTTTRRTGYSGGGGGGGAAGAGTGYNMSPYLVAGLQHQANALHEIQGVLPSVVATPDQCEPALLASSLLLASSFALLGAGADESPVDLVAQVMVLCRGCRSLQLPGVSLTSRRPSPVPAGQPRQEKQQKLESSSPTLSSLPPSRQHRPEQEEEGWKSLPQDAGDDAGGSVIAAAPSTGAPGCWPQAELSLGRVMGAIAEIDDSGCAGHGRRTCLERVAGDLRPILRRWCTAAGTWGTTAGGDAEGEDASSSPPSSSSSSSSSSSPSYMEAIGWLQAAPGAFLELVRTHDPLALALLAHWVLLFDEQPHAASHQQGGGGGSPWWMRHWPRGAVGAIWAEAGRVFPDLLAWPLAMTH